MTDQDKNHPTQGRRRRHKSPASLPSDPRMALPRLVDYLDTADGPSDEEEEKNAKHQRSEPTTPRSTSSRPPHEYDEVMGITQSKIHPMKDHPKAMFLSLGPRPSRGKHQAYYRRGAQETQKGKGNRQVFQGEYQKVRKAKEGDWREGNTGREEKSL